ncbi:MAG: LptF/LptG family permease, partial [Planctomycetes bacterium]|nr:LptF/LptG family permease [Planctomycetota bacterium]
SDVADKLDQAREAVQTKLLFDHLLACLEPQAGGCELESAGVSLRIEADRPEIALDSERKTAQFRMAGLKAIERTAGHTRQYQASEGRILLLVEEGEAPRVQVQLTEDVTLQEVGRQDSATSIRDLQLGPFDLPPEVQTKLESDQYADERLWDPAAKFGLGPQVDRQLKRLRKQRSKYLHQIYAEINVRTVYSISVLVLAVLGAALGIIYRGGHVLVAFGISFVPTLFVVVLTILGKNIAKGESTLLVGLGIMWLGLIVVTSVDYVVLKRYLPR